jgi:hypothetical protein
LPKGLKAVAKEKRPNFAEWEVTLDNSRQPLRIEAHGEDAAGNIGKRGHVVNWNVN